MRYPIVPRVRLPNCSSLDCSVKGATLLPKVCQSVRFGPVVFAERAVMRAWVSWDDGQRADPHLPASGRLISSLSFDFGPVSRFCMMSASVKRAIRISPSVARLRS